MAQAYSGAGNNYGFKEGPPAGGPGDIDPLKEKSSRGPGEQKAELEARLANKKRKYKQYKEAWKRTVKPKEEWTSGHKDIDTAFIPPSQKAAERETLGSAVTYPTSQIAREDRRRIESLIPARGVISNKWTTYEAGDVTIVDLLKQDQYFEQANFNLSPNDNDVTLSFLSGVTAFIPLLPPPEDKCYDDYIQDIKYFGFGTDITRLKIALGQATCRAWFSTRHASLNQAFYVIESKFLPLNPATGEPRNLDNVPRIALFYKKFLDCDPAWETTVPGGREIYDNMLPPKEKCEEFMKKYLASPIVADRLKRVCAPDAVEVQVDIPANHAGNTWIQEPTTQRAFQDLQLHDDTYEMLKHTMASVYLMVLSTLAEYYASSDYANRVNSNVGSNSAYPPGLIMASMLSPLIEDATLGATDANEGYTIRTNLSKAGHPLGLVTQILRKAFRIPPGTDDNVTRALYDGYEWINSCTPNVIKAVRAKNIVPVNGVPQPIAYDQGADIGAAEKLYIDQLNRLKDKNPEAHSLYLSGIQSPLGAIGSGVTIAPTAALAANHAIQEQLKKFIQPGLNPTGTKLFSQWGIAQRNIPNAHKDPSRMVYLDKSGNVRARNQNIGSKLRSYSLNYTSIP